MHDFQNLHSPATLTRNYSFLFNKNINAQNTEWYMHEQSCLRLLRLLLLVPSFSIQIYERKKK